MKHKVKLKALSCVDNDYFIYTIDTRGVNT